MHARRRPIARGGLGELCQGAARRAAIRWRAGTLAICLLLSLLAACAARKSPTPAPAESGPTNVQTIAVFPFDNDAATDRERLDFLREWLPDAMAARIVQAGGMRVIDRGELLRMLAEQKVSLSDLKTSETRLRLGGIVGAQTLVFGAFSALGDQIQIDAHIVAAENAVVLQSLSIQGATAATRQLAARLSDQLLSGLGLRVTRQTLAAGLRDDRALAAAEHYYQGLALERAGKAEEAIDSYKKAVELDQNDVGARERLQKLLDAR
jgi:tetratricopeptide (TPR) repeat protein